MMATPVQNTERQPKAASGGIRWGLYLPIVVLVLIVAGWSAFWFVARGLVSSGIDRSIGEAAARGDIWTCHERSIGGYPFRLEIRCRDVTLARTVTAGVTRLSTGPVVFIGQPHTPGHIIAQGDGPLLADLADGRRISARWDLAEASRRASGAELERLSVDIRKPVISITNGQGAASTISAATLEAHLRRNPTRNPAERARDIFLRTTQMVSGDLDALLGDTNNSDLDIQLTATHADALATGLTPATMEAWRTAGGVLELSRVNLRKGIKQIEAKGQVSLDEDRRLAGRLEPAAANIDQFAGIRLRGGAMDLAAALSGRAQPASPDGLKPLPSIDLRAGRFSFGPIRLPIPPLQPLY
jgi:hypothetical protein